MRQLSSKGVPVLARTIRVVAVVTASLTLSTFVAPTADAVTIERVPVPGVQPDTSGQVAAAMSPNGNGDGIVLFGADAGAGTWTFDGTWRRELPPGGPSERALHAMAPDPTGGGVLLFGGRDLGLGFFTDTWRWNPTSREWSLVCDGCAPGPLAGAGMATTSAGDVLLFGGITPGGVVLDTVWRFDDAAGDWVELPVAPGPSGRTNLQMAAQGDDVFVFGGVDQTFSPLDDTWRLVSTGGAYEWQLVCDACPPGARERGALVPAFGGLLLIGGLRSTPADEIEFLSDVWLFDGTSWQRLEPGVAPTTSEQDPFVPYFPLLATFGDGAVLVENHAAPPDPGRTTRSFLLQQLPEPVEPVEPIEVVPTFTG